MAGLQALFFSSYRIFSNHFISKNEKIGREFLFYGELVLMVDYKLLIDTLL